MFNLFNIQGGICAPKGFYAQGVHIGLKPQGKPDLAYIYSETPAAVAAIFTANTLAAAPIEHFRRNRIESSNFILVNAKNANAMTGQSGLDAIDDVLSACKQKWPQIVNPVMSSTGVIGVPLPKEKIIAGLERFTWQKKEDAMAAQAIMTTDRFEKSLAYEVELENGQTFRIGAMAKGAGMINPSMATMLCFITTDAMIDTDEIACYLRQHVHTTFNAISVDGDTSTNDTVMVMANGRSEAFDAEAFSFALEKIMHELALMMVSDGEGATKTAGFDVTGAKSAQEAEIAAKALSNSLLVKTALFGEDPNWGRIASTIGACGVACSQERLRIAFEDVVVFEHGKIFFDAQTEARAAAIMKRKAFTVHCNLGMGEGCFKAYGCDLGHAYVSVNADYRT